ncbi:MULTISPECIES: PIG-L deacetylase family protein [Gammaproteobacteria]|uniref:PIG-L deacetylase family protein n=1 Tax=Gammaproteobacteria TaxID=1236 RepID=UPI000DD09DF9|nr:MULTISPECIES: PIG-L deacetylase family protein [Gammaproteobacteria]RTE86067.1 PIG-L family deacetylase [Aliidiomarina sp. B3213]TCZ91421.1 PIG-L family deacetylase [Lysobacter sp. N42]
MKKLLVVAPHADDETLGCGGTLLKYASMGYELHWLIVTQVKEEFGFSKDRVKTRRDEINKISVQYPFSSVHELGYEPAGLDKVTMGHLITSISNIIKELEPEQVLTAYRNDAHSDHEIVYDAVMSATKSFRYPFVKRILAYETISETDFGMKPEDGGFKPNVFVDISEHINKKLEILTIFESEIADFPFPRSLIALESLARVRGAQSNSLAAEAFMLIKEII